MGVYVFFLPHHEEASSVAACNGNRARKIGDPCAENPHTPNPNPLNAKQSAHWTGYTVYRANDGEWFPQAVHVFRCVCVCVCVVAILSSNKFAVFMHALRCALH